MRTEELCKLCKKNKFESTSGICNQCLTDIRNSFHYGVGGVEISKEHYDAVIKRGYIIPEELDKDRK